MSQIQRIFAQRDTGLNDLDPNPDKPFAKHFADLKNPEYILDSGFFFVQFFLIA